MGSWKAGLPAIFTKNAAWNFSERKYRRFLITLWIK